MIVRQDNTVIAANSLFVSEDEIENDAKHSKCNANSCKNKEDD